MTGESKMTAKEHFIISGPHRHELKIKRSVFIGSISPVAGRDEAETFLETIRGQFHDATHNCFAYRIDEAEFRFSDDGEPSGTAGKPILAMIDKYSLLQVALVVTRYYGGIKLGTGGLIRAYSQCAEETVQKCKLKKFVRYHFLKIQYPYNLTRQIHYVTAKHQGIIDTSTFDTAVSSVVKIPAQQQQAFERELLQTGEGQVQIIAM